MNRKEGELLSISMTGVNVFIKLMREQVKSLTWQGVPISQERIRVRGPSTLGSTHPIFPPVPSAVLRHVDMEILSFP